VTINGVTVDADVVITTTPGDRTPEPLQGTCGPYMGTLLPKMDLVDIEPTIMHLDLDKSIPFVSPTGYDENGGFYALGLDSGQGNQRTMNISECPGGEPIARACSRNFDGGGSIHWRTSGMNLITCLIPKNKILFLNIKGLQCVTDKCGVSFHAKARVIR
jgi:hypothetical protein